MIVLAQSGKIFIFAVPLPNSIMVVRQILDLNVEVRALVGQLSQNAAGAPQGAGFLL